MYKGLTQLEVHKLRQQYGENTIQVKNHNSLVSKFLAQFANILTLLLVGAATLSFFSGELVEGGLIIILILLNAIFGVYQEHKAEQAVAMLRTMTVNSVRLIREGKEIEVDSKQLVPGDIMLIEEGVKIPADALVLESSQLEINEASLTGESIPVAKKAHELIFMGTIVTRGRAVTQVKQIGLLTKFGQIASELSILPESKTLLQHKLEQLTEIIGLIGIIISVSVFFLATFQGSATIAAFLLAISLAVAIVPEGLPAVMTITLASGMKAMAKKKAIVRKMSAIEALGNITLIATDKTGTLTMNKMETKEIFMDGELKNVIDFQPNTAAGEQILLNSVLCSTASLKEQIEEGESPILGDPTEGALLVLAQQKNVFYKEIRAENQIIEEWPFNSDTKRMSVKIIHKNQAVIYTKGAPESIFAICTHVNEKGKKIVFDAKKRQEFEEIQQKWAAQGLRVLGFSVGERHHNQANTLLGLVAIYDPPRPESALALKQAHQAGIRVVMITGDNPKTAMAIGSMIGFTQPDELVITGDEIEQLSDQKLMEILPKTQIFARINPFHKKRIVELYQKMGERVLVTGDGVNDSIALKQADVGAAMGKVGTDVARETADIIITDDNFSTIVTAIAEGRNIVKNLKNSIKYLFTGNMVEAVSIVGSLMLGLPILLFPIQILYINLLSDGIPALALAFSPQEKGLMDRPPAKKLSLLEKRDFMYVAWVSFFASTMVISCYYLFGNTLALKRSAVFAVLAMIQTFIFIDVWISHRSLITHLRLLKNKYFLVAFFLPILCQAAIMLNPLLAHAFEIQPVDLLTFTKYLLVSMAILLPLEVGKRMIFRLPV